MFRKYSKTNKKNQQILQKLWNKYSENWNDNSSLGGASGQVSQNILNAKDTLSI